MPAVTQRIREGFGDSWEDTRMGLMAVGRGEGSRGKTGGQSRNKDATSGAGRK